MIRFAVTLFNFISDPKLRRIAQRQHDLVSILIPARDEEENIIGLLDSILMQDYEYYEVIIYDDCSSDNTYFICQQYDYLHPKFRVIKGEALPEGWLGKNYACHQLAKQAKGKYLLYLDADERINDGLINSALYRLKSKNLALLSLFTNQDMKTPGERLIVPLMNFILLNLLPLRLILLSKNESLAAASGQFMLFDAGLYYHYQWHVLVKDKVVEDVEIMRLIKHETLRGETLLANGLIWCRMYNGYSEAINGFSKNFLAAFNYNLLGFALYLFLVIIGPVLIITTLNASLIGFMIVLIVLSRMMVSALSGQNALFNVIAHPLQIGNLFLIAYISVKKYLTRTSIWKNRRVG